MNVKKILAKIDLDLPLTQSELQYIRLHGKKIA